MLVHVLGSTVATWALSITFRLAGTATVATGTQRQRCVLLVLGVLFGTHDQQNLHAALRTNDRDTRLSDQ